MIRFVTYTRPLQDWERLLFHLIHRKTHTEFSKMRKKKNMFSERMNKINLRKRP